MYAQLCLLGDLEKEPAAQTPGNKAVLPRGCREKKKKVGVEASLQWEGQAAGEEVGAGLSGASHPWAWRGDWARGNRLRHHHHREAPPLTFLERPPTARWAPASEALSVLAARGQHNGQHSPTWWGPAGA